MAHYALRKQPRATNRGKCSNTVCYTIGDDGTMTYLRTIPAQGRKSPEDYAERTRAAKSPTVANAYVAPLIARLAPIGNVE